jgi:hypothetical protein
MTTLNRIALLAAGAAVLGSMAYGQSVVMKAEIPFAFRTSAGVLPAGVYTVTDRTTFSGAPLVGLRTGAMKSGVFVVGVANDTHLAGAPAAIFRCGADGCELTAMRSNAGTVEYASGHKRPKTEMAMVAIPLIRNGD